MKVITAIGNPKINEELKKDNFYEVIGVDIQYQDGIFEILEENKNIDYLILNLNLIGELNENELIEKIFEENKKIKLIIILEKENEKTINDLFSKNIKNILLKNKNNLNEINNIIKNKKEINLNLIKEKNNFNKNKLTIKNKINYNKLNKNKLNKNKINNKKILLFGNKKNNKNLFINLFLKLINKKILIIELINISKKIDTEEKEQTIKINK